MMVITKARYAGIMRRVAALIIVVVIIFFAYNPLSIPIQVAPHVRAMYEVVDALQPGDVVYYDYGYGGRLDVMGKATQEALINHILSKDVTIIFGMLSAISPAEMAGRANMLRELYGDDYQNHPDYGTKIVSLLYLPGYGTALQSVVIDVWATYQTDEFGTPFSELPIMQDIRTGYDIDLYCSTMVHTMLATAPSILGPYGITFVAASSYHHAPMCEQVYRVDLMAGYMCGTRMGAEYSLLRGVPTLAMSFLSTYLILAIVAYVGWIVTNYLFVVLPMRKTEEV